ncbi:hypothetical protein Gpo141_00011306 [Globisporangium polare]
MSSSDHAVFKRFSRQQLIVRRRSIGFQTLTYAGTTSPLRCKHCGRHFNPVWKEYLCHVCGLWVCHTCSSVVEREREMYVIHFIRACVDCLSIVNKWSDPDLLTEFAVSPWVVQCSKCQLALHLADTLRTKPDLRHAVLGLLKYFGHPDVDVNSATLSEINEDDWVATNTAEDEEVCSLTSIIGGDGGVEAADTSKAGKREVAQLLVQHCFDVAVKEMLLAECVFAESDGSRDYPIYFDDETEAPGAPTIAHEPNCDGCIQNYDLMGRNLNTNDMQLLCELAAKELDAHKAFISILNGKKQHSVAVQPGFECGQLERSQTFCAFALTSSRPFLVRDATLDIRFRNFEIVRGSAHKQFYLGFPIVSSTGVTIASLCIIDIKPRMHITTMQYSIIRKLAETIGSIWTEKFHQV